MIHDHHFIIWHLTLDDNDNKNVLRPVLIQMLVMTVDR